MRIWDIDPPRLCRQHLLGEHRELHAVWNILTLEKQGYRNHPETVRWENRLRALYARHERLVQEMEARGYSHRSPLDPSLATGSSEQPERVDSEAEQLQILAAKPCPCPLPAPGEDPGDANA